jgi:DNA-directed RNA polymerase specialized sigma24 family protein
VSLDSVRAPLAAARPGDPAAMAGEAETARRFGDALRIAWARLTSNEALALALKHHDGLRQRDIARILGVGPPRVSRIVRSAVGKLREGMRPVLGTDSLPWPALRDALGAHLASLGTQGPTTRGRDPSST